MGASQSELVVRRVAAEAANGCEIFLWEQRMDNS